MLERRTNAMSRPKSSRLHMSTLRQNQQSFSASLAEMRKDMDQRLKSSGFKVSLIENELRFDLHLNFFLLSRSKCIESWRTCNKCEKTDTKFGKYSKAFQTSINSCKLEAEFSTRKKHQQQEYYLHSQFVMFSCFREFYHAMLTTR